MGSIVTAMTASIGAFSGALINPARFIGPMLFMGEAVDLNQMMLVALTPFLGCYLAGVAYKKLLITEDLEDKLD